jgi:hypothetical protein
MKLKLIKKIHVLVIRTMYLLNVKTIRLDPRDRNQRRDRSDSGLPAVASNVERFRPVIEAGPSLDYHPRQIGCAPAVTVTVPVTVTVTSDDGNMQGRTGTGPRMIIRGRATLAACQ